MAPNLAVSQHAQIRDMIISKFANATIARTVRCSTRSLQRIRLNLRCFGTPKAPPNGVGRRRTITPPMLSALLEHLIENPELYQDEMANFLYEEFEVQVTVPTISRALASAGWSRKAARRIAKERNADLRDFYLHNLSEFHSYHLVYIDESGCDNRIGFRRTGWSPLGVTPIQIARLRRDQRHQILPAYTQDGILFARVFSGSTDTTVFEDFVEQLLHHCGRWPEPKSILIMDNALFHHSARIEQLCKEAGVKLLYLPPYSPDLNPIEEFFAELKMFIKRNWQRYTDDPEQDFKVFLEWCVDTVGSRKSSAEGHFRHAGIAIKEP
jgi:transposase